MYEWFTGMTCRTYCLVDIDVLVPVGVKPSIDNTDSKAQRLRRMVLVEAFIGTMEQRERETEVLGGVQWYHMLENHFNNFYE
jgi:hypothetical protein